VGLNPDLKVAICSYSATIASNFNRDIQRIIDDKPYSEVFPETSLNEQSAINPSKNTFLRNSEVFEIIGRKGFVRTVGVGGSLTSISVDIGIIDDPFKDREEAKSMTIRDKVWSWYTDVFKTRLHNESQQLLIMTRWDQDDLAGRILKIERDWEVVTFQAIKERESPDDPRKIGEVLWPKKHSLERILEIQGTTPFTFDSLYQQEPKPSKESLVFPDWNEYDEEPDLEPMIGLDFGFSNDPNAIAQVKIRKGEMYLRQLLYEGRLTNTGLDNKMQFLGLKKRRIVADSEEAKTIEEFKTERKYNMIPCVKGKGSVNAGIAWMKDHKIFIHKDSHNFKEEFKQYQFIMVGGVSTNEPIDSHNHLIDAARYTRLLAVKTGTSGSSAW
jgi:hypothetical protein